MRATVRLGRVRGIQIGVHWSLLVISVVVAGTLATSVFPDLVPDAGGSYWAAAVLATALFFASILAHELAHALVALRRGQRVEGITLWLLGGVASLRDEAPDPRSEFLVAIAGPAMSIALGVGFTAAAFGLDATLSDGSLLPAVAIYLGIVNVILALFNLLPGAPLDGGRILTAALWAWRKDRRRAQITASRCGFVLGILLIGVGVLGFVFGFGFGDLWTALVGWFVIDASRSEELGARVARSLDEHTVGQLMSPPPPSLPEWTTVADARATFGARGADERGAHRVRRDTERAAADRRAAFGHRPGRGGRVATPRARDHLRQDPRVPTRDRRARRTPARRAGGRGARRSDRRRRRPRRGPPRGRGRRAQIRSLITARGTYSAPVRNKRLS